MKKFKKPGVLKLLITTVGFVFVLLLGYIDYITGDFSLLIFYLCPIALVSWFAGKYSGIFISIASGLVWYLAETALLPYYSYPIAHHWNVITKLEFLVIFSYLLSSLKEVLEHEKKLGRTDYLTNAANRRLFFELANIEIDKTRRFHRPFTAVYMDIDNFKTINDNFGHTTGDSLLKLVADTIKNNVRVIDIIARLGGDEFAILLPETGYEQAVLTIDRIKKILLEIMEKKNGLLHSALV